MKNNLSQIRFFLPLAFMVIFSTFSSAQKTCTSNPTTINSNINFGSIAWTASGGATVTECNNMADGISSFTGNVIVDLSNNKKITLTNNVTITGNFPISGGPGSTLSVNGGYTLHVTGDLGDAANNGVAYEVVTATDKIVVDGTLYGKNNNAFSGNGSISGGALEVKNGSSCGSPCPVAGGFSSCNSGDAFCSNNSVLPVSLISFSVKTDNEAIALFWATASELNFDYFSIERSLDGIRFEEIGKVTGHGTTDERHDYSFEDEQPVLGKLFYRLKTVDYDGYTEYFNIESVTYSKQKSFVIYPNPVVDSKVNFQMNFNASVGSQIMATDLSGVEVFRYEVKETGREFGTPLNLDPGTYIFKINTGDYVDVKRIVVK